MAFMNELEKKLNSETQCTENGAVGYRTSGKELLDLNFAVSSMRNWDENEICKAYTKAYYENPLLAVKWLFYLRDIRGNGMGERRAFRICFKWLVENHFDNVRALVELIPEYGRYDDWMCLLDSKASEVVSVQIKKQLEIDICNMEQGREISLLAKWIKTADASSSATRKLGILTAQKLGYPVYNFKRIVRSMRKQIGVVESLMSAGRWDEIKYPEVPSRAMMIYRKAFMKHDAERFGEFINKAEKGEVKINASTLFPYDIVEKILYGRESNKVLEAQWKALPDYVEKGTNALVMADVSGSMRGRPMATSIGLAIYFAERNVGAYHNLFMTFSDRPETVILRGETLEQKICNVSRANWDGNTDLKAAFERVLEIAKKHNTPQEEMPKAIVVISDMEIDYCGNREWSFYDKMANKFCKAGYVIPNIIFWNVNSRHDVFHADHNRKGVQLASGQSVTVFKQILQNLGYNPVEAMENTINSERYDCIAVE